MANERGKYTVQTSPDRPRGKPLTEAEKTLARKLLADRVSVADTLQRSWYASHGRVPWWTRPLALLYGCVTGTRRALYRRGWHQCRHRPAYPECPPRSQD